MKPISCWDFEDLNNLYGYSIVRATGSSSNFQDIATLRDPLADRYDDLDPVLTPGTSYFYNVGRLDTINFPNNINTSNSNPADVTIQVSPLNAIQVQSPTPNAKTKQAHLYVERGQQRQRLSGDCVRPIPGFADEQRRRHTLLAAGQPESRQQPRGRARHSNHV